MEKQSLIRIVSKDIQDNFAKVGFKINPEHMVFKGHFPGSPILPGVLEMQIAEMIILDSLSITVKLCQISNVKFLKPIFPNSENSYFCVVSHQILDTHLKCVITISDSDIDYMKMNCTYTIECKENVYNKNNQETELNTLTY